MREYNWNEIIIISEKKKMIKETVRNYYYTGRIIENNNEI